MRTLNKLTQAFNEILREKNNKHQNTCLSSREKTKLRKAKSYIQKAQRPLMLTLVVATVTSVVGNRFYNQPELDVGTVSPVRIVAPKDGSFEDLDTTRALRDAARNGSTPVLKIDNNVTLQIKEKLTKQLNDIQALRKSAGDLPFVSVNILSLSNQIYLRQIADEEWQKIKEKVDEENLKVLPSENGLEQSNLEVQNVREILERASKSVSANEWKFVIAKITQARNQYSRTRQQLNDEQIASLSKEEKLGLLDLSDLMWENTKTNIIEAAERILTQGIPEGLPQSLLEQAVQIQLGPTISEQSKPIASKLLMEVLKPNLTKDEEATKSRAQRAVEAVDPVIVTIKQGEVIVETGEQITQEDFVLLDNFGLSRRGINWMGVGLSGLLVTGGVGIFFWMGKRVKLRLRYRDQLLLCLLSTSVPLLALVNIPLIKVSHIGLRYTNLPAIGLLVSSFYSPPVAVTQVLVLTGLVAFTTGGAGWEFLLAGAAGGIVAAIMAGRLHSREDLAVVGVIVGLTQGGVYFIVSLILTAAAGTIWSSLLLEALLYGVSGLAWSIVALGVSPYLERFFDVLTPIRLAELSNPNRPLLKRLATETPGTFQHTMFVATFAEAAARELHCNVELVRAGTLYHDIGKMHDPLGFIENQFGAPNKHDSINDPYKSAEIIKKHVSEGLVMARKYGLPQAICDFIPQHQGTLLISYFYFQAQKKAEEEGGVVEESDFRYDGPIPQSRETAIVMLADGCEAALRSLKDVTPDTALLTVKKIFQARWRDGQLADSGLKYEDLPVIAEIFVRTWQQSNHKRIAYPKAALEPKN